MCVSRRTSYLSGTKQQVIKPLLLASETHFAESSTCHQTPSWSTKHTLTASSKWLHTNAHILALINFIRSTTRVYKTYTKTHLWTWSKTTMEYKRHRHLNYNRKILFYICVNLFIFPSCVFSGLGRISMDLWMLVVAARSFSWVNSARGMTSIAP